MADLLSAHSREGVLVGAGGSRWWQPGEALPPVLDDDPMAALVGAEDQSMSSWESLTAGLELPAMQLDALDAQPPAPEVEVVEQGRLDLDDAPLLHARDRAMDTVAGLDAREARLFAERVDALVQVQRLTAAAGTRGFGAPLTSLGLELGGTRRLGQTKALSDVDHALRFTEVLPLALAGLRAGTLHVGQAQAVLGALQHCSEPVASEVERRLFANPRSGALAPSDLRKELERLVLLVEAELEPGAREEREGNAVDGRRTSHVALPDGMAGLFVTMTAEQGLTHAQALDELCRLVKAQDLAQGITRTATQRRSDVEAVLPGWVLQLLSEDRPCTHPHPDADDAGGDPVDHAGGDGPPSTDPPSADPPPWGGAAPPPISLPGPRSGAPPTTTINVHIPLATALGQSDAPAYLERHGWISAAHARRLMPQARLRPVHVDAHGQPVQTESPDRTVNAGWKAVQAPGTQRAVRALLLAWAHRTRQAPPTVISRPEPQYAPSAALERHLRMRDLRCTGPGCSQPSHRCELDHLQPFEQGGPTVAWNFGAKSTRCHNAKTHGGWTTTRHADGSTTWTSPLRRRYWTPAFWTAPPVEDLAQPLPDPDDPALTGDALRRPSSWLGEREDHAPGLGRDLHRHAQDRAAECQDRAESIQEPPCRDALAWLSIEPTEGDTPPPF